MNGEEENAETSGNGIEVSQEADNKAFEKDPDIIKGDLEDTPYVIGVDDIPPSYNGFQSPKLETNGEPVWDGGGLSQRGGSRGTGDVNETSLIGDPDASGRVPGWSPEGPATVDEVLFSTAL